MTKADRQSRIKPTNDRSGSLCDIHRCPLYGRFRGHSGDQPSELSARPPSPAISLPVALPGGLSLGGLLLLELALALLGLGDLPPVDVPAATSGADRSPLSGANRKTSAQSELYRF